MQTLENPGVLPDRITLLFDCFAALGTLKGYGQTQLASEMQVAPQIIRRRAADARHARPGRGMPIDQIKLMAKIAVREIEPLQKQAAESLTAWIVGLDSLTKIDDRIVEAVSDWLARTDPRGHSVQQFLSKKKRKKK